MPRQAPEPPEESSVMVSVICKGCGKRIQQKVLVTAEDDSAATMSFSCPSCQRTIAFAPTSDPDASSTG